MGLEDLVAATGEVIPDGHRMALAAAQKASLNYKRQIAHGIVGVAAVSAAGAGASPIPFSDAFILVPIEVGMLAGISAAFGLELSTGFLSTLVAAMVGSTGATFAGRALVANLLKLIPGAGTAAGAVISGTTAAALTTALGESYLATLVALFNASGGEPPDPEDIAREFKRRLALPGT
jgi:uncharacterized protein (DUF697 family)